MTPILALLIVIWAVVVIHELGHFWAARLAGAKATVFSIGFGRPIIKWHDRHGTEWRIAWLQFGGFVAIYGQDDMFDRKKFDAYSKKKKEGHYLSLPAWKQAMIIAAGVFMNFILAWVIYTGLNIGTQTVQLPVAGIVSEGSAIKTGDRILQINGAKIHSWDDLLIEKTLAGGKESNLLILRGEKLVRVKMGGGLWGVSPDANKTEVVDRGLFGAILKGAAEVWTQSKMMMTVLGQIISGDRSARQLGGIIHIADVSGKALAAGFVALMSMIALISVNLGIINLFPLPVLDGGYLLILLIEAAARRKMRGKTMAWIMRIGWWFLCALIAFTVWNDMTRILA